MDTRHCISLRYAAQWFDSEHHEMILTISSVNVYNLLQIRNNRRRKHCFPRDENSALCSLFFPTTNQLSLSQSGSSVQTASSLGLGEWLPQQHRTGPWRFLWHLLPSGRMCHCSCDPRIWKPPPSQHKCFLTTTKVGDRHRCCFRRLTAKNIAKQAVGCTSACKFSREWISEWI